MYLTVKQQVKHLSKSKEPYLNKNNALALDLGVNNLVTVVSSNGKSFIIDGRRLKSINQWYN